GGSRRLGDAAATGRRSATASQTRGEPQRDSCRPQPCARRPVIYLDTSVALAQLLAEDRLPPPALWRQQLIASRLLEYEIWTRLHAHKLGRSHGEEARLLLSRIALVELAPPVLERALAPFPMAVRTLDALHLATIDFLRVRGHSMELATYDDRLAAGARAIGIALTVL